MLDFIDEKLRFREEASNVRVKGWEVEPELLLQSPLFYILLIGQNYSLFSGLYQISELACTPPSPWLTLVLPISP